MSRQVNILDKIVRDKREEVAAKQRVLPLSYLKGSPLMQRETYSLSEMVRAGSGIITEFKRRSPSRQVINQKSSLLDVVRGYQQAGASGVSVLTDTKYFGGSLDDLVQARSCLEIPLLRKEFITDPYQIYEARAFGADAVLLIAAVLSKEEVLAYSELADRLGMEVLLEIHDEEELQRCDLRHVQLVGVNNRNLKTFEVDLETSRRLSAMIPGDRVRVSESGISEAGSIRELRQFGFQGFLIGENFMRTEDPARAATEFLKELSDED